MGFPLGPLLANVFTSSIEEKLHAEGISCHLIIVDMPKDFLKTLNHSNHIKFTMEVENDGMPPFLGIQPLNWAPRIESKVFVKPTNSSLPLPQSCR